MSTSLGDATIRIALDPRLAKDELEKLSQEIEKIDKAKQEQSRKIDDLDQKAKDSGGAANRTSRGGGGAAGMIPSIVLQAYELEKLSAKVIESILPKVGTAVQSGSEGTMFEGIGKMVNEKIQALADIVTGVQSKVDTLMPFAEQAIQYNVAALRLGGRFPADQQELMRQLWEITNQQEMLKRNLNRDIDNGTIDSIFKAGKALMSGGN